MDILVISKENNILHIFYEDKYVDYTLYDSKGHNVDGGEVDFLKPLSQNEVIEEITKMVEDRNFNSPFFYLVGKETENILELIQREDERNTLINVNNYLNYCVDKTTKSEVRKEKNYEKTI